MGNSYYYLNDFDKSIEAYKNLCSSTPDFKDAINNLAVVYRDAGRNAGENKTTLCSQNRCCWVVPPSIPMMQKPTAFLGIAYGLSGRHSQAILILKRWLS